MVDRRINQFKQLNNGLSSVIFKELCFCILTANYDAEKAIRIHKSIDDGFLELTELELAEKLKILGYRFPNKRARYIVEARKHQHKIKSIVGSSINDNEFREWLVSNILGIGYKEASHFLRNIGFKDVAIVDFHIMDLLDRCKLIDKPRTLSKGKYLKIESILKEISERAGVSLAELDLYLWYLETGKILK
jgi:N-glycosylase/DNA lyase